MDKFHKFANAHASQWYLERRRSPSLLWPGRGIIRSIPCMPSWSN